MNYTWKNEELNLREFDALGVMCDEETFRNSLKDYSRIMGEINVELFDEDKEIPTARMTFVSMGTVLKFVLELRQGREVWIAEPEWTNEDAAKSPLFYDALYRAFAGDYDIYRILGIEKPE